MTITCIRPGAKDFAGDMDDAVTEMLLKVTKLMSVKYNGQKWLPGLLDYSPVRT